MAIPLLPRPGPPRPAGGQGGLQDFIYQLDVGFGAKLLRLFLFLLCAIFVMLLYATTQFHGGLKSREAMDTAQLARNVAYGKGFVTDSVRPFSLWYMRYETAERDWKVEAHPELFQPPVYPYMLGAVLKALNFGGGIHGDENDRWVMALSLIWLLPSLWLAYLLALEFFDRRVAIVSTWVFLLSQSMLEWGISGRSVPFLTFVLLGMILFLVRAARRHEAGIFGPGLVGFLLFLSAVFLAIGTLTRYTFGVWLFPILIYIAFNFKPRRVAYVALYLMVFALPVGMWTLHQMRVCGKPFGLAPYMALERTYLFPKDELMRLYDDDVILAKLSKAGIKTRSENVPTSYPNPLSKVLMAKVSVNLESLLERGLKNIGGNFIILFFFASLLHPFKRPDVGRFLRFFLGALSLVTLASCLNDGDGGGLLEIIYPVTIIFGVAFFWILVDRLGPSTRLKQALFLAGFIFMNALPLTLALLPPNTFVSSPILRSSAVLSFGASLQNSYPDITPAEFIRHGFESSETTSSDIPWAVAWYGERRSVWTPWTLREFLNLYDQAAKFSGLYLTEESLADIENDSLLAEVQRQFKGDDFPVEPQRPWSVMAWGIPTPVKMLGTGFPLPRLIPFEFKNMLYVDKNRIEIFLKNRRPAEPIPVEPEITAPPS